MTEHNIIKLNKMDVAKRHFMEAVILFFENRDPVAIHHLIHASHEILVKITKKNIILNEDFLTDEGKKIVKEIFLKSKNFIKHADRDQDETLNFNPIVNKVILLDCACMLVEVYGNVFFPGKIYTAWCAKSDPALFTEDFHNNKVNAWVLSEFDFNNEFIAASLKDWVKEQGY